MSIITFLVILAAVVVALVVGGMVVSALPRIGGANKAELRKVRSQLNTAQKSLRIIANGGVSPALEAQLALDTIESLEIKELN